MNPHFIQTLVTILTVSVLTDFCQKPADPLANEDFDPRERYSAQVREINRPVEDLLPYFKGRDMQPFWSIEEKEVAQEARALKAFAFTDQTGQRFARENMQGRIAVVNFFFTRCPGICPVTMPNLKKVRDAYTGDDALLFVSYSITPDVDTPEVLQRYGDRMGILSRNWRLLTGPRNLVYELARESLMADIQTGEERTIDDFIHSEQAYLMDKKQRLRGFYNLKSEAHLELLIKDIVTLKKSG